MKQKFYLLFTCLLLCNFLFAQNERLLPDKTGQWIFDKSIDKVDMYHMITQCNENQVTLLKFENKNSFNVQISWKDVFVTDQVAEWKESLSGEKKIKLSAGQIIAATCGETTNSVCLILAEKAIPHYKADIRNFEFKDVSVTAIK